MLPGCLASLAGLNPGPMEILLIDNGSTDGSLDVMQAFARDHPSLNVTVLTEARPGAAGARNRGIRAARGDIVAFTDADCETDPTWLGSLLAPFADPSIGAVAGRIVSSPTGSTVELFSALFTLQTPDRPARHERWTPWEGGFPTANLAVRRPLLEALDGFHEEVRIYGEDYDLCARLYQLQKAIAYTPEARVLHRHRTSVRGLLRQAFGFGRSHAYLLRRHLSRGLWVDVTGHPVVLEGFPIPAWIDLASADKKVMAILIVGAWYHPALLALCVYAPWLATRARGRGRVRGIQISTFTAAGLAGLLLAKSFAMTLGKWWGSLKYHGVCL